MTNRIPPEVRRELSRIQEFLASRGVNTTSSRGVLQGNGWSLAMIGEDVIVTEVESGSAGKAIDLLSVSYPVILKGAKR